MPLPSVAPAADYFAAGVAYTPGKRTVSLRQRLPLSDEYAAGVNFEAAKAERDVLPGELATTQATWSLYVGAQAEQPRVGDRLEDGADRWQVLSVTASWGDRLQVCECVREVG